jgi:hypothetical protein
MRKLKIIYLNTLIISLICSCERHDSINLNDNNFLKSLIRLGIDRNGDGEISPAEAESVRSLNLYNDTISDLSGIEAFINLDSLICNDNDLKSLDISRNVKLVYLSCGFNDLSSLDISKNVNLRTLGCDYNPLGSLDISKNPDLEYLYCEYTQLSSLDISNNSGLVEIECGVNRLTALDISHNTLLQILHCHINSTLTDSKNLPVFALDP